MISVIWLILQLRFPYIMDMNKRSPLPSSFRKMLVRFSVKFYGTMPDDVLQFCVDYFRDLKKQQCGPVFTDKPPSIVLKEHRKPVFAENVDPEKAILKFVKYKKTPEERQKLSAEMKNIILFHDLDPEFVTQIIEVMIPKKVEKGTTIIKQGEDGDFFFIIDCGKYEAFITDSKGKTNLVTSYDGHGSFGELALLYNIPRAATVICTEPGKLWAIERDMFKSIVAKNAYLQRNLYKNLISSVPMLSELNESEKLDLADALQRQHYKHGDCIIRQNESADGMYFIESGTVKVTVNTEERTEILIKKLKKSEYFGELALIAKKPRAANVYAEGAVVVAFLRRDVFERILGPCMKIMRRNAREYAKRMEELKCSIKI